MLIINAATFELASLLFGGVGGLYMLQGHPWGLTTVEAFGVPALLQLLATGRVLLLPSAGH